MIIVRDYLEKIEAAFKFSEKRSFCQIATVAKQGDSYLPKMRTVLMYYEQEREALRFTCSTQTHKWSELKAIPKVSGIYFDSETTTQYRFEANAILIDKNSADEKAFHEQTWHALRSDLRHVLWQEYLADESVNYNIDDIFPYYGNVILKPYYWDIFKLDTVDFAQSNRVQMVLENDSWKVFEYSPKICPLDLNQI
jgi:hypothetical protein